MASARPKTTATNSLSNTRDPSEERARSYQRSKHILALSGIALSFLILAVIQFSGLSAALKNIAYLVTENFYISLAIYLFLFSLLVSVISLPLSFLAGFLLEHKYLLSNQTFSGWVKDEIKGGIITFLLFLVVMEAFYFIAKASPDLWWIYASLFWAALTVVLARLFPILIIPLFYKYKELPDGELRQRAIRLTERFAIKIMDVYELNLSKTTKKANAAIVGFGAQKRVVLADNLINEFTGDEIEVVLAHELAHHKCKHTLKLLTISALSIFVFFFILRSILPGIASQLGFSYRFDIALFPFIYLLFSVYEFLMMPIHNGISRAFERQADRMALEVTEMKGPFISLMEKLASSNLADKEPSRIMEILFYNHPSIGKRIKMAESSKI